MRKLSIKTLSLVLSLLLMISVFSVLSFSAGAEAEATLGDLNSDGKVDQTDIDLLEAALTSGQGANESYDVSGNRIVGSDDLIVLKNMVDSNQPALEDKLADGETEDILSLVTSTEGGAAQSAIVRGYSTKALEMNATGNMTVLFAESQDWSGKVTLEMDTFWLVGERTVTVALLGADGKTVLGRPGMVAAQENGWSRIYVPLTGVTARERAEVGGIVVSVAADAHVYLDNLSLAEAPESDITRADLEAALVEVAWDYHLKGGKVQYDSTELTTRGDVGSEEPMSKAYGGTWRTNTFSSLEDATSDSTVFSVCSDYCWNVYYEALGYPVLGHRVNAVTRGLFMNSEHPQDMVVARWWDDGYNTNDSRWADFGNSGSVRTPAETLVDMIKNYDTYLRPGDILVAHGNGGHQHAMLYVGDGKILHCGGGKFNLATGADDVEEDGAVNLATIEGTFLADGTEQGGYFVLENAIADTNENGAWFVIVRPLDVLTVDDDDQDASNDKLDLGYVLDTGKLEYELANNDLSPVPTTGFTITESTYSRMQYPGMDIDRTVSVKNYGTVAKGGQLTYTITITNNSNNTNFPKDATAYSGLVITETVPANTTYVSNVGGGTVAGGKITWTVDVPAGSSKTVSYTVTATGNVGDKIVCGGGKVANIPSNVLTTTIGGQKWTASELNAFVNSTVEAGWNSNDGYKISANAAQETGFAERIYNEVTGLDLQLPGIQELADNFFTQTRIHQPYGLHYYYNTARTRHMYVLNDRDEMAEAYRIYRDMLVEGFYGGVWVYSNDYNKEPRIIDPRAKYLEAGDILVYMNLEGSVSGGTDMEDRDVTDWRVLVYLGSDTYASLESNGRMRKVIGDSPALAGLMYDMFLALRPSQAYENLNTAIPAYTATAPDLTAEDASYVYQVEVSDVLLSDTNAAKITALTADEGWTSMNLGFATQVYKKIGLDIGTDGIKGASYATVVLNCFNATSGGWLKPYNYTFRDEPVVGKEELHAMVMLYGGTCFNNPVALTSLNQLHVGDVILMGYRDYSAYLCAVYQGEGNFLVVTQQKAKVTSGSQVTNWFQKNITSDSALTSWLGEAINSSSSWRKYEGYVVLRPSRAFDDINEMAVRDMSEGRLTEAEKQALSNLTVDNWLEDGRSYQLSNFVNWAYKAAKVDVSAEMGGKTVNGGHSAIFKKVSGKLTPMTESDGSYNATYAAMLVPGLYGGANVAEHPDRILTAADLRVGDIFASAKFLSAGNYLFWVGLYQGNGQFLLFESTSADAEYKARIATDIIGTDFSQDWMYYYVLRPDFTVPRNINESALTEDECNSLANFETDTNSLWWKVVKEAYDAAGVTVDVFADKLTFNNLRKAVLQDDGTLVTDATDYTKMLVLGYYGGSKFTTATGRTFVPNDLKVGDFINAVCITACEHSAEDGSNHWQYIVGLYIGNGKFLVSHLSNGCEHDDCSQVYIDEYGAELTNGKTSFWSNAETLAGAFQYYFVLRPERLAPDALQSIALDQTSWTAAEAGDTVTLNVTKNPTAAAPNANIIWVSSDESIAKVEDGVVTAIRGGTCTITAYIGGNSASCTVTVPARAITTGALIPEELAAIASYNRTTAGGTLSAIAEEVYALAGINLDPVTGSATVSTARTALIVDGTGVLIEGTTDWHKMLVPGTNGGSKNYATEAARTARTFTPADFKVGDIFAAMSPKCADSKWPATTAVYLGNGKFSVSVHADCSCKVTYIDDIATMTDAGLTVDGHTSIWAEDVTVLNTRWLHYFVLRPERLAADALQSISLNETELALEKNATATLTVTKAPVDAAPNAAVTWVSSNENAVTVVDGKLTAVGVGTATITAYCDGNSASCTVTVSARSITSGALTAEEMAAIEQYEVEDESAGPHLHAFAPEVYASAGVDISTLITAHVNNTRKLFMNEDCTLIENPDANLVAMLVPGYYGGSKNAATAAATSKIFVPDDFKVGDLFCAFSKSTTCAHGSGTGWKYYTGIYQGNGKFLVSCNAGSCADCKGTYEDVCGEELASCYTSFWSTDVTDLNNAYLFYFVLRPERLAADALQGITLSDDGMNVALNKTATLTVTKDPLDAAPNATVTWVSSDPDVATVVDGKITALSLGRATITAYCDGYSATCVVAVVGRDIADGALTAAEIQAIQSLTSLTVANPGPVANEAYAAATVDVSGIFGGYSFNGIRPFLFNNSTGELLTEAESADARYLTMLIPGYYGGTLYKETNGANGKSFTPNDLKMGDLFMAYASATCTCETSGTNTVAGVYVGNGKFVMVCRNSDNHAVCRVSYIDAYDSTQSENVPASVTSVWADGDALNAAYKFYCVLRPERLADDALQSISLNAETVDLTTNETYQLSFTKTPAAAAPEATASWVSSNTDVVTVADGKITAVGVGTATVTAYVDGNSASCEVTVTARNVTAGVLTDREKAAISALEKGDVTVANPGPVMGEVYDAAGINVSDVFGKFGANDLFKKALGTHATPDANIVLAYRVDTYGGATPGVTKTFVPDDFKVGDVLVANYRCSHAKWPTITAVYQGEGKFLVVLNKGSGDTCTCSGVTYYDQYASDGNHNAEGYRSIWGAEKDAAKDGDGAWLQYMVFRPERLAVDAIRSVALNETELTFNYTTANSLPAANAATLTYVKNPAAAADPERVTWTTSNPDVATVVDGKITVVGAGTCTITVNCDGNLATCQVTVSRTADARGSLTATEQAALQAFTGEGNTVFADFAKSAYTAAGIDISPVFAKYGFYDLARKNFDVDGGTYDLLAADALTEEQAKFRKMLMFDYYGGSKIAVGKTFTPENFEIGDLFFAVRKCPTTEAGGLYIAGIYQGDGNFLIYEHHPAGCGGTCRSLFTDEYDVTEETVVWGTSAEMKTIQYYFVLRPSRLAMRHISDGALTATEQETLTNYSREEMGGTLSQVAIDAYTQAGIVVDFVFEKASISTARTALIPNDDGVLATGDTVWHKMLVAGSNGGKANAESNKTFTPEELQVGDLFCAIGQCEHGKWPAVTAVYLGNGRFQVSSHASCDCLASYVDDIANVDETGVLTTNGRVSIWAEADALKYVWKHFFVLRPSQLAE